MTYAVFASIQAAANPLSFPEYEQEIVRWCGTYGIIKEFTSKS